MHKNIAPLQQHHFAALERAANDLDHIASDCLLTPGCEYSSEIPAADAKALREIAAILDQHITNEEALSLVRENKYAEVLRPFVSMMEFELYANAGKGDRPGWLRMDTNTALLEIFYHLAKLQRAVNDRSRDGIREHSADVANMSMMLADICGCLHTYAGPTLQAAEEES